VHVGGASTNKLRARMQREMYKSLARYAGRHWRDPGLLRLRAAVGATALAQMCTDVALRRGGAGGRLTILGDALRGWPEQRRGL
jgi:hypothetical protein